MTTGATVVSATAIVEQRSAVRFPSARDSAIETCDVDVARRRSYRVAMRPVVDALVVMLGAVTAFWWFVP